MIAQDLYQDIIKYIPIVDLRDLSRAHPIFDEVIYKMGFKIFYDDHNDPYWNILCDGHTIIVDELGKKHLLFSLDERFVHVNSGNIICKEDIRYYVGPADTVGCAQFYDPKNCHCAYLTPTKTILRPYFVAPVDDYHSINLNIVIRPLSKFTHICIGSQMILLYDCCNLFIGNFTTVFADGRWK